MGRQRDDSQIGSQHRYFIHLRLAHIRKGILGERETLKSTFPETQRPQPLTSWSAACGAGLPFPGGVRDIQRSLPECSAGKTPGLASAPSGRAAGSPFIQGSPRAGKENLEEPPSPASRTIQHGGRWRGGAGAPRAPHARRGGGDSSSRGAAVG